MFPNTKSLHLRWQDFSSDWHFKKYGHPVIAIVIGE